MVFLFCQPMMLFDFPCKAVVNLHALRKARGNEYYETYIGSFGSWDG